MPVGKKAVHNLFSSKIADKRKSRREASKEASLLRQEALKEGKSDPSIPAKVDNFKVSTSLFGPHKIKKQEVKVVQRKVSPKEGKQTVNAKPADKLVHKVGAGKVMIDPTAGVIEPLKKTKKNRNKKDGKQSTRENSSRSS